MSAWKSWEREVARNLRDATGRDAERVLTEPRNGGNVDIATDLPLAVQAKHGKRPRIYTALQEAAEAADGTDRIPVAAVMRSHGRGRPADKMAVLPWATFCRLMGELEG